ncbi:MAG TPA: hydantoinase/oxoprolinase family protein [Syntrophorhabdales bacterium]|nr:hydantoinase/oxoprolinase family protein [Syntrophorhabdales bacterium]
MFEIVIDTGGTFTDAVLMDKERKISTAKFPTNVADPSESIMGSIGLLAEQRKLTPEEILADTTALVIGTTLSTNAILEKKGAKCCLIHTKGFRDIPELGSKVWQRDIYNLRLPPPDYLIPRQLRFGVEERMQYDGQVVKPLNRNDVLKAVKKAKEHGVEVPVVCFLHSYINPSHEEQAAAIIKKEYPDVVLSSHILRRWMEYDRLSTTEIAGYVKPVTARFLRALTKRMKDARFKGTSLLITCAGGVASPDVIMDNPSLLIGSGPAAGPLLGQFLGKLAGFENAIVLDMGGTSSDLSMLPDLKITTTTHMKIGEYKNASESVDVACIGAGGGSIARLDERGMLYVGPESAGADPGPACYGKGGRMPTVTDADLVLGYIPADYFLGGTILLDKGVAEKVIETKVARPLGIATIEAAHAIASLVEDNMSNEIFLVAVRKGLDPRNFSLVVGGGAGPVHAVAVAARLGIKQVYIPRQAAVFCAFGASLADYKYILNRFLYSRDDQLDLNAVKKLFKSLEEEGRAILKRQGVPTKDMKLIRGAEMRYFGQLNDVDVALVETKDGEPFTEATLKELIGKFHEQHRALFGWSDPSLPTVLATLKLQAIGMRPPLGLAKQPAGPKDPSAALKRKRPVYFKELGGFVQAPCYNPDLLHHGHVIPGPAIVEETKTTIVVPQGAELFVDPYENYIVRR